MKLHHNQRQINWSQYECQTRMVIHSQHYAVHHKHETKGGGGVGYCLSGNPKALRRGQLPWPKGKLVAIDPLCRTPRTEFSNFTLQGVPPPTPASRSLQIHSQYSAGGAPARQPSCFGGEDHGDRCVGMIATNRIFRVPSKPPPLFRSPSPASTDRNHLSYRPTRPPVWLPSAAPLAKSCRILKKSEGFRCTHRLDLRPCSASTGFRRSVATKPEVAAASASANTGHPIAKIRSTLPIAKIRTRAWGLAKIRR